MQRNIDQLTGDGIPVRCARERDLPAIRHLIRRAANACLGEAYSPSQIEALCGLAMPVRIEEGRVFLAEIDGRPAGCAAWAAPIAPGGAAEIRTVYTDPDFAGRGVASWLLAIVEAACFVAGHTSLVLEASIPAVGFYTRNGWKPDRRERLVGPNGTAFDVITMRKSLAMPQAAA